MTGRASPKRWESTRRLFSTCRRARTRSPPTLLRYLPAISDSLRRYPDPGDAAELLAEAIGVDPPRLMLTNGGSEAISLVDREIGGRVRSEPEFGLHPRNPDGPVWRSDPHNPSGRLAYPDEAADVWDEAFYPLATGQWTADRVGVVVGSLTKVFASPGLRVGYIIADDVERFARHQPQWSVSSLAAAALPELLELVDLPAWSEAIATARKGAGRDVPPVRLRGGGRRCALGAGTCAWFAGSIGTSWRGGSGLLQLRNAGACTSWGT